MSEFIGRMGGLGIIILFVNFVNYFILGDLKFIDWGVFLVLGIFIGFYIVVKGFKEFRWRLLDIKIICNSVFGGIFMGFGVLVVGGCFIGNGLVEIVIMSW